VTAAEHPHREAAIGRAVEAVHDGVDLDRLLTLAATAPEVTLPGIRVAPRSRTARVAYFRDPAFSFYYPANLEALEEAGAELVPVSPQDDDVLPAADALYIGGGFPEVHASRLADGAALAASVRARVAEGMPVYAECGGLMYLARELRVGGVSYPMAGVLDLVVEQCRRPQGHGYEVAVVDRDNPFFAPGVELRGHEFHYSRAVAGKDLEATVLDVRRGSGVGSGRDGIVTGRVWASYLHLHALASPEWAEGVVNLARTHAAERHSSSGCCATCG
jgi:cobyrinic acid a,c-diamide synthase